MLIEPFEYVLKDGRRAIMRSPTYEDIPGMFEYLRLSAGETEFILRYPEECDKYTVEGEKLFIDQINSTERGAMLVCIVDGRLVGNCEVRWSGNIKLRHRAVVGIAIIKEFWGQGIGTRFFEELIRIAEGNPELIQIDLDFVEGNTRARALYEKMGFRIVGLKPNALMLKDGTLLNEVHMSRPLKR